MMKSMTGFGKAEAAADGKRVSVEVKSLNGKNLDINCRLPRNLSSKELKLRETVRQFVERGSLSIYVNVTNDNGESDFKLNTKAAEAVYNSLQDLRKTLKIKEAVSFADILSFSSQIFTKEESNDEEDLATWELAEDALKRALTELNDMRSKEGDHISQDLTKRIKGMHETIKKIEIMGIDRIPMEREKMRQRIAQLFENDDIDEQRLNMEIVILSDKLDISEECVRLHSHIKLFLDTTRQKETQGRKLNHLLQEMHREINTIGSKANDTTISHMVVELKEELERIREQVQNIE